MTTNVYDVKASTVASDSRWSFLVKNNDEKESLAAIVYVDDTGFDKMIIAEGACALFAGNSRLIDAWKQWIASTAKAVIPRPPVIDDFAMCIIDAGNGDLIFEHGQKIADDTYRFAGTGAKYAHKCWLNNKCAQRAVKSASDVDDYSGGEVKFFNIKTQQHNVTPNGLYELINEATITRGVVMYTAYQGKTVSVQEAAATDPRIRTLLQNISTGEASAEAPSGHDPIIWTETDVKRLDASLGAFFGLPLTK